MDTPLARDSLQAGASAAVGVAFCDVTAVRPNAPAGGRFKPRAPGSGERGRGGVVLGEVFLLGSSAGGAVQRPRG